EPEDLAELAAWTNGSPFERFKNKKKLGKGGQGTVYRVDFQQLYAVKEVILSNAYKLHQLLKEAKASYKLRHNARGVLFQNKSPAPVAIIPSLTFQNLLSCLFRYFDGKKAYLVTQLMDKGDLEEIVKQIKGNLSEAAAAYVIRELLGVLYFLHNVAKTAHRNVKPANILANSTGEIKLADFGLCGDLTEPRETGLGTPFFLSPEMVIAVQNGANEHDLKVDTWAVGVTLFYLLTKQFPLNSPNVN
ncbi:Serine/threonine protein kinase, partial [Aphelenchoides avenae]